MSDPLSVAGSAVGIVSLGLQVVQSLYHYYYSIRNQYSEVFHTARKLEYLLQILDSLKSELNDRKFKPAEESLVKSIKIAIQSSEECIQELEQEAIKFKKIPFDSFKTGLRVTGRRLAYPLRQSTLQKLDEDVDEIVAQLSLALQSLQQKSVNRVENELEDVKGILELVRASQVSKELRDWLKAPDPSINFNEACKKRHPGTGLWFVKGNSYDAWLRKPGSFLWLTGFAGCGKSVLSSTAIQYALRHRRSDPKIAIGFFFFTFNDERKRDASSMLRALVIQLSTQLGGSPSALVRLKDSYQNAIPMDDALLDCLHQLVLQFTDVYIVLDALDESPRQEHRGRVLQVLEDMRMWSESRLHLLVTSRDEPDIRLELAETPEDVINLKNAGVDKDIALFVSGQLRENRRLRQWQGYHDRIESVLTIKAKGVFRWVECHFCSLASCPPSEDLLEQLLSDLPETLNETYQRMLCNIPPMLKQYARQMLTILCCAMRPLTVEELIDAIAIETGNNPKFNPKRRLKDIDALKQVCPSLIDVEITKQNMSTVHIAHFSVQEYLESDQLRHDEKASYFSVSRQAGHSFMTTICLTLMLDSRFVNTEQECIEKQFAFARYAAKQWPQHYHISSKSADAECLIFHILHDNNAFFRWASIWNQSRSDDSRFATPILAASGLGLLQVLKKLVEPSRLGLQPTDFNHRNHKRTPLQAASNAGHVEIVEYLVQNGADLNLCDHDYFGTALMRACERGNEDVVRVLLDNGANPEISGSALARASRGGHLRIVQMLLDHGVELHSPKQSRYAKALVDATSWGCEDAVQLLLEHGACPDAKEPFTGKTALQIASQDDVAHVAQVLLRHGADANQEYGNETPLEAAVARGNVRMAMMLLDHGANDLSDLEHGARILGKACSSESLETVQILLDHGVDVNHTDAEGLTALHCASLVGDARIAQLLLDYGANVNAKGPEGYLPLHVSTGNEVARLLLENGADINTRTVEGRSPLHTASSQYHFGTVELLLENGANPNVQDNQGRSPLHDASSIKVYEVPDTNSSDGGDSEFRISLDYEDKLETMRLLLAYGADINIQDNDGRSSLHEAICTEIFEAASDYAAKLDVIKLLLKSGADINLRDYLGCSPLHEALHASAFETFTDHKLQLEVVKLLLGSGADVNMRDGQGQSPLYLASCIDVSKDPSKNEANLAIIKTLLDAGADIDAINKDGTPLSETLKRGHYEAVRLLLSRGANVNLTHEEYGTYLYEATTRCYKEREEVVRLLLDHGADPNLEFEDDYPLLHYLVCGRSRDRKRAQVIRLLLDGGADIHAQTEAYGSVLQAAVYHKRRSKARGGCLQLLIERGVDINNRRGKYGTALQIATKRNDRDVMQLLRDHGADENVPDDAEWPVHKLFP